MVPVAGLLDIEVIPIEIQAIKTDPSLEVVSHTRGRFESSREGGDFRAVRQQVDTANFSRQAQIQCYNSTHKVNLSSGDKNRVLSQGNPRSKSLAAKVAKGVSGMSGNASKVTYDYTPETVNLNWVRDEKVLKGTPGKVDFVVTQYPDVIIDYLGGPLYVPPSSAPDYVEPEMNVVV